jgi:CheY-like chemotaxis protein/two-component sensor histidine kinase
MRAKRLVEQLLSLRPQPAQTLEPVSIGALVQEAAGLLRASVPSSIDLVVDADSAPLVLGDASQLHQVVVNLCTNAWLATVERPSVEARVEVRVATQTLDRAAAEELPGELAPGDFVVLSVADNGVGMDQATKLRIFEPFFTTREVGAGTGLGLSVVQANVASHKGAVAVESVPGAGTTFRVYLPQSSHAAPAASIRVERALSSRPPAASRRVLYVDDDAAMLRVVRRLLSHGDCRVTTLCDPREARDALLSHVEQVDLLVVDFSMPHLTGLELAALALERRPDLPIVLVSGFLTADVRREAEQLGVARIIGKVDIAAELLGVVHALLDTPPPR